VRRYDVLVIVIVSLFPVNMNNFKYNLYFHHTYLFLEEISLCLFRGVQSMFTLQCVTCWRTFVGYWRYFENISSSFKFTVSLRC